VQRCSTIIDARKLIKLWKSQNKSIGFVATMGYLHEGHASLMRRARAENEIVVVSIFVNPKQFGPAEDFTNYPRDLQKDLDTCAGESVDMVFFPEPDEMYPEGFCAYIDMDGIKNELCGKSRPEHFRGVCTVVAKLFAIITPDRAYFGQKDAQQVAVIQRMTRDLNMDLQIISCPIVRESDGLAQSSRNAYLSQEERNAAPILIKALRKGERMVLEAGEKDPEKVIAAMKAIILTEPLARIDYADIVNAVSIERVARIRGPVLLALAVFIGKTRLIDNAMLDVA